MGTEQELTDYTYRGTRALVLLHERHMNEFLDTWKAAKRAGVALPKTDDPAYQSLDTLLRHVLSCARGYMTWTCKMLELPDPQIRPVPGLDEIAQRVDDYLEHLLAQWRTPLSAVTEKQLDREYTARWGGTYCVDAMLEHAVMHPIRHRFQLEELV
ncbi:MAG: hypothetical protein OEO21_04380 [Candidatus Krumholzibacteria bacterium]|nr:hypothetical protein [Candidatus Krumholzibacteria bacterium]